MRVLVACEESQAVCIAFRAKGHEAYSCDLMPSSGGHPEWHIQGDVLPLLKEEWDIIIAFPPCTHLCVSGARYFEQKRKDGRQAAGVGFFLEFTDLKCKKVAVENPVGIMSRVWRKPNQIIQPWMFGHDASKSTCLWLKGLPCLQPTNEVKKLPGERYANQSPSGSNKLGPSPERSKLRSKTFPGIAEAMAAQWGGNSEEVNYLD